MKHFLLSLLILNDMKAGRFYALLIVAVLVLLIFGFYGAELIALLKE